MHGKHHKEQCPPFCVQVELTEGCNLRCPFCGINGIRGKERQYKFMTVEIAERIVLLLKQANWSPRIEFAMHGEPSLNPNMLKIIRLFRNALPQSSLMMSSNGAGFLGDTTKAIDTSLRYLNVLAIEQYKGVKTTQGILRSYQGIHEPIQYPQDKGGNPHRRRKVGEHDLVIIQDISKATKGTHACLNNHAGCGAPKNDVASGKRCAKPFRELSIRWDGNVALCCNDWRGIYQVGNISECSLGALWQSPAMRAARGRLYRGVRDFGPCSGCDALSYRPGLLPDQKGLLSVPKSSEVDQSVIVEATSGAPYTSPVLRPWEHIKKPPVKPRAR